MPTNLYGPGDDFDPCNAHVVPALMRRFAEARAAGAHEAQWDARDAAHNRVAAGLYLYRLESPGRTARGKVSVVR